jgi:hypothetical protein
MAFQTSKYMSDRRTSKCIRCGTHENCNVFRTSKDGKKWSKKRRISTHCNPDSDQQVKFFWGGHYESAREMYEAGKHCFLGSKEYCRQFMLKQLEAGCL